MTGLIQKNLQGKKVIFFLVVANVVYLLMILLTIPQVMQFSGGMKIFDMMPFGYDTDYAQTFLARLGDQGRSVYLTRQLPLDLIYPLASGVAYCLLIAWLLNKIGRFSGMLRYLCFFPLVAGLFDYLENFGIITLILRYPEISSGLVTIVSAFSLIKSMLSALFFSILIVIMLIFIFHQVKRLLFQK